MAMVDGPMKANSTSPEGARTYLQSKAQIQGYLEVCNQRRTFLAWAAFHIHQLTLELVTLFNPLQAWGSNFVALVQTLESGRLVLSLAIIATLAAFMFVIVIKHKHYFYEQQPNSRGKASAEGVTGPIPKRLTLLQLLEVTHTDHLDATVVFLLVGVHLVWRMASGLSTCRAMTWQACAFIAAAIRTHLLSSPLQWTRSFLSLYLVKVKQGWSASVSRIVSVFKACTGQTARANKMTAHRDGLAARLQVVKRARTTTDDYLHDLLRKSENRALEAEGQTRHYSQRVRTLKWQKFQDKQSDGGLAQKYDSLTALVSCIRQEKKQVEERLHGTFTHVSSLEEKAARTEQSHAAELSDVITNLELSKTDLVQSEQARIAEANSSASLTAELQLLKSFCDSQTHKLAESGADLYISDHLCKGLEQRLEELTAQRDRLAYQAESLRNGKFDQDREVRAAEFKCVNLRQQLAEAHSAKTELTLHAYELTAEKLAVSQLCGQERLQVQLTAKSEQNQQLADKVGGSPSNMPDKEHHMQCALTSRLEQQSWKGCACPSVPFCKRRCGQWKGNICQHLQLREGSSLCCTEAGAVTPDKQPKSTAANIPTPKLPPAGAGEAVPASSSPSAKGIVNSGKGAPSAAQTSPANPPAAGSSQAVLPALKKSPAQGKAVPSKPGTPKHDVDRKVAAGPKPGSTPLRDLSKGSKPARPSASPPLKDCAKSSHSADKKAVRGGTAATTLAGSKLDQPAAETRLLSASKESKSLTSSALDKGTSHSSSSTGMQAFSKGMSPHGLVKGRAACNPSHHPKSRRAADASSRTVSSTAVVSAQSTTQTQPSHFAFSPFRSVKGQQAEGQQEKSKAAPPLAAMATT
ncbi:hypothetical protein WJX82_009005 [Trebouxia sp. C0006]